MPVLANLEAELDLVEGDPAVLIDGDVDVSDSEQDWDGGTLTVTGLAPGDVLGLLDGGQITLSGSDILVGGQTVGTFSFEADGSLRVVFTADADNAAVEAVVESVTFQSTGDNPVNYRNLQVTLTDAAGDISSVGEALLPPAGDPLHGVSFDETAHGAVGDIDNDGDVDILLSAYGDGYHLLRNDGTASAPDFTHDDAALSLSGSLDNPAGMTLFDIDGDGFLDLIVGRYSDGAGGFIQTFKGDGAFGFTELTGAANPFDGISTYAFAAPGLADVDGDGFIDLVVARGGGRFDYFEGTAGGFVKLTGAANPLDSFHSYGGGGSVTFADIDGDGDLDFASGGGEDAINVFINTSTVGGPSFTRTLTVYNDSFDMGVYPLWVDIDNDGDIDQVQTTQHGEVGLLLLGPASPSIDVYVDGVDDATTTVDDSRTVDASGPISGNLLSNDIDPDSDPEISSAEVDGEPVVIGEVTVFPDGTRLTINYDGSYLLEPGSEARNLGAPGSGATNTSLSFTLAYVLATGETGGGTLTINGVDDKDSLLGTAGDDAINAGVGNDTIHGFGGGDTLHGDDGNDSLWGGDDGDLLHGDAGADKLYGEANNDVLHGGVGADYLYGGDGLDNLIGGDDNDYLDGGAGGDLMAGGLGNDVYIYDDFSDFVTEAANEGYDIVRSFRNYIADDNIEAVQAQGTADLVINGNSLANNLQGNIGNNVLAGQEGVDTLNGNDGDDIIIGGVGNDLLRGGTGADRFVVYQESVSNTVLETDQVYDFSAAEGDRIDLMSIDANTRLDGDQGFRLVSAFSKYDAAHPELTGQMTLTFAGGVTTVRLDVNGDARVDYQIKINGDVTGESGDWLL
ncbi:FG-GAP-like repeat-containing protein [Caulobacter sp. NIBR1757]|uniref:calcium-binding protein n=1 Tax=Caulobacter sp. NIBR1757 TaxID=3016000 RepID=UPI0022EFF865|nr:FG-GAP-like repeat-containing protein [Caulobacter sp. NIBR1757]WGM37606.1 hypothetical protein AMEJIAPC_00505 [Caulobacter sp. NIBR1757]